MAPRCAFDGAPYASGTVSPLGWILVAFGATVLIYMLLVLAFVAAGRRTDARAIAGFIPDCVVLLRRLMSDQRVPRRRKALLWLVIAYLAMPIDLVPDFIPVAGQLDDAIIVALVLRALLRGAGEAALREHWPGPDSSLTLISRLAYGGGA
jgi:uncharacterized membrane protein YkvA (DUF1232 family)